MILTRLIRHTRNPLAMVAERASGLLCLPTVSAVSAAPGLTSALTTEPTVNLCSQPLDYPVRLGDAVARGPPVELMDQRAGPNGQPALVCLFVRLSRVCLHLLKLISLVRCETDARGTTSCDRHSSRRSWRRESFSFWLPLSAAGARFTNCLLGPVGIVSTIAWRLN